MSEPESAEPVEPPEPPEQPVAPAAHPFLVSELIARSGMAAPPGEGQLWIDCPICERHMSLDEASVEPAEDPQDITAYRCANGCAVLVTTGHPNPVAMPGSGRYRIGDYAIAPNVSAGLMIVLSTGQQVRLTPQVHTVGESGDQPGF